MHAFDQESPGKPNEATKGYHGKVKQGRNKIPKREGLKSEEMSKLEGLRLEELQELNEVDTPRTIFNLEIRRFELDDVDVFSQAPDFPLLTTEGPRSLSGANSQMLEVYQPQVKNGQNEIPKREGLKSEEMPKLEGLTTEGPRSLSGADSQMPEVHQPVTGKYKNQYDGKRRFRKALARLELSEDTLTHVNLDRMSRHDLIAEKQRVKRELQRYDGDFRRKVSRLPTHTEKEPMRPLYVYYSRLKTMITQAKQSKSGRARNIDEGGLRSGPRESLTTIPDEEETPRTAVNSLEEQIYALMIRLETLQSEKAAVRAKLQSFQKEFVRENNRKLLFHNDTFPVDREYHTYKQLEGTMKAEYSQLRDLLIKVVMEAEYSQLRYLLSKVPSLYARPGRARNIDEGGLRSGPRESLTTIPDEEEIPRTAVNSLEEQIYALMIRLETLRSEKGAVGAKLQSFTEKFESENNRKIRFHHDIFPVEREYHTYKKLKGTMKAEYSQLRDLLIEVAMEAEYSQLRDLLSKLASLYARRASL